MKGLLLHRSTDIMIGISDWWPTAAVWIWSRAG